MVIAVTGATGQLGRLVLAELLGKVPADRLRALARSPEKAADLAARGVDVRHAGYVESESLDAALAGVDKLLLISGSEVGQRVPQHRAVIDAARKAGVGLLAYTSILGANTATFRLAHEHQVTEAALREAGLPYVLLRNGWYTENHTATLPQVLETGTVTGNTGEGRVASAARQDFAEAAAAVLTGAGHENMTYELSGDTDWSFAEYAAEVTAQSGARVGYEDVPAERNVEILLGAGMPREYAELLTDTNEAIKRGALALRTGDLSRLIKRPTTPLADTIKSALKAGR